MQLDGILFVMLVTASIIGLYLYSELNSMEKQIRRNHHKKIDEYVETLFHKLYEQLKKARKNYDFKDDDEADNFQRNLGLIYGRVVEKTGGFKFDILLAVYAAVQEMRSDIVLAGVCYNDELGRLVDIIDLFQVSSKIQRVHEMVALSREESEHLKIKYNQGMEIIKIFYIADSDNEDN